MTKTFTFICLKKNTNVVFYKYGPRKRAIQKLDFEKVIKIFINSIR